MNTPDPIEIPAAIITLADARAVLAAMSPDDPDQRGVAQLVEELRPLTLEDFYPETAHQVGDDLGKSRVELNGAYTRTAIAGRRVVLDALLAAGRKALGL